MSAKDILTIIRERQLAKSNMSPEEKERYELERSMKQAPLTAEEWTRFAKEFVEELGGSKVNEKTGMSDEEFLEYMRSGEYFGKETKNNLKLRDFLRNLE